MTSVDIFHDGHAVDYKTQGKTFSTLHRPRTAMERGAALHDALAEAYARPWAFRVKASCPKALKPYIDIVQRCLLDVGLPGAHGLDLHQLVMERIFGDRDAQFVATYRPSPPPPGVHLVEVGAARLENGRVAVDFEVGRSL